MKKMQFRINSLKGLEILFSVSLILFFLLFFMAGRVEASVYCSRCSSSYAHQWTAWYEDNGGNCTLNAAYHPTAVVRTVDCTCHAGATLYSNWYCTSCSRCSNDYWGASASWIEIDDAGACDASYIWGSISYSKNCACTTGSSTYSTSFEQCPCTACGGSLAYGSSRTCYSGPNGSICGGGCTSTTRTCG